MPEKYEKKKKKPELDGDSVFLTPEMIAKADLANRKADAKQTGSPTVRGQRRLLEADSNVARRDATGASTYQPQVLEDLETALDVGFLGGQDTILLSQMASEIIRGELDITTLPPKTADYVRKLVVQKSRNNGDELI